MKRAPWTNSGERSELWTTCGERSELWRSLACQWHPRVKQGANNPTTSTIERKTNWANRWNFLYKYNPACCIGYNSLEAVQHQSMVSKTFFSDVRENSVRKVFWKLVREELTLLQIIWWIFQSDTFQEQLTSVTVKWKISHLKNPTLIQGCLL